MKSLPLRTLVLAFSALLGTACSTTMGSKTVPKARFSYSEAVADSWNQQMLLNLVRMRYRDTPQFLQISSVLTQYTFDGRAGASASIGLDGGSDSLGASSSIGYSERPTITYVPLEGEEFAKRILTPLSPSTILLLSQAGWSAERLLLCCVQRMNDLPNATAAAGPTPDYVPPYEEFQEASRLLRELQIAGVIEASESRAESGDAVLLRIPTDAPGLTSQLARLRQLLGLDPASEELALTWSAFDRGTSEIALVGRSLSGIFFFLSQGVEAPLEHEDGGLVTVTRDRDGQRFDWQEVVGPLLLVRSSQEEPKDAFVKVHYRNYWFSIADTDLNSKTTFGLLRYLFSLQASPRSDSPLLTVSAGG